MENNNQPQTPMTEGGQQAATVPQPAVPQVPIADTPKESSKIILWFVAGLIIIALIVGGGYFYLSRQQITPVQTQNQTPVTVNSPSPSTQQSLEGDLNNINVDTSGADSDFVGVDQDLQQL